MTFPPKYLNNLRDADVKRLVFNGDGLTARVYPNPSRTGGAVPVVVSDGTSGKASVFSPTAHYLDYPVLEMGRNSSLSRKAMYRALSMPWRMMFRATQFDRVVYVNHWLLNGAPALEPNAGDLNCLIEQIVADHPRHAVVFSAIVPALTPQLNRILQALGGRSIQSRVVHLVDMRAPLTGPSARGIREKRGVDRRLYESRLPDRISDPHELLEDVDRLRELYSQLYVEKYSAMNPQYTSEFFRIILESGEFQAAGWRQDGRLEAFNIRFLHAGINHWSICGYDANAPRKKGLFRLIAAEDILGPGECHLINWGGGNQSFKRFRGASPSLEFDVIFDGHLPARRRLPWSIVREVRGFRNRAETIPAPAICTRDKVVPGNCPTATKVALITSIPELVAPFLSESHTLRGFSIPLAVLIRPSSLMGDRLRDLSRTLGRQARINDTWRWAQLLNRVAYYRSTAHTAAGADQPRLAAGALEQIATGREVIEARSANELSVIAAIRESGCELGIVVGADVLTRATLDAVGIPLVNLHTSDPAFCRGMPPVFWEIRHGRDELTLTLHKLILELDAGSVLAQRNMPIAWRGSLGATIAATRKSMGAEVALLLTESIPAILANRVEDRPVVSGPIRTIPRITDTMRALRICRKRGVTSVL